RASFAAKRIWAAATRRHSTTDWQRVVLVARATSVLAHGVGNRGDGVSAVRNRLVAKAVASGHRLHRVRDGGDAVGRTSRGIHRCVAELTRAADRSSLV